MYGRRADSRLGIVKPDNVVLDFANNYIICVVDRVPGDDDERENEPGAIYALHKQRGKESVLAKHAAERDRLPGMHLLRPNQAAGDGLAHELRARQKRGTAAVVIPKR